MIQNLFSIGHWKKNLVYIWLKIFYIICGNILATENQQARINDVIEVKRWHFHNAT